MPMSEMEYFRLQEQEAIGEVIAACAKAIFDAYEAETMAQLQRTVYKYTDCGPAVSFELHYDANDDCFDSFEPLVTSEPRPSPFVYCGDTRAETITKPWLAIRQIGVSSIVEGSDAEVPLQWLDLEAFADPDGDYEGDLADLAKAAVAAFGRIVDEVNAEACALWEEANPPCDDDVIT